MAKKVPWTGSGEDSALQPVRNNRADSIADMKCFFMGFSLKQMKWALTNYSERVKICTA
jgi:hypothetical protein